VEILSHAIGPNAAIGVGVTIKGVPPKERYMVGWNSSGWGYHADDGKKFTGKGIGELYGPMYLVFPPLNSMTSFISTRYSTGDRVGCGVLSDGTVYFTLNGIYLGSSHADPKVPSESNVFATLSVVGFNAHLKFIFDRASIAFNPAKTFEVGTINLLLFVTKFIDFFYHQPLAYLKKLPELFCNLDFLQESFSSNLVNALDVMASVNVSTGVLFVYLYAANLNNFITYRFDCSTVSRPFK
jgi:SPRY domain